MKKKLLDVLNSLVSQDTRYVYKAEGNLLPFLTATLEELGFSISVITTDGRPNILAQNNKPGKAILFYGHIDTVDIASGWTRDPFKLTIEGNKAYGLGSYDMKGGIAAFLRVVDSTQRHIKIFLAIDEENISSGAWDVIGREKSFFDDIELIISAEPNFGHGLNGITVGRTGRAIFTVITKGKPVHLANYKEGVNAIYPSMQFINELKTNFDTQDKMTVIQPRSIRTDTNGMSLCEKVEIDIEVLLGSLDSLEQIKAKLIAITKKVDGNFQVRLKARKTPYLSGYRFTSFQYQDEIAKIIKECTGKEMQLHSRSSVGDDNVLATLGIPVITWGPDGGGAHEPNEWVDIQSLVKLSNMYKILISEGQE